MTQLSGKADIYIDGVYALTSQEGSSIDGLAGIENTPVFDSRGNIAGYTSKGVPGVIKANFLVTPTFSIDLLKGDALSLVFACDNGWTALMASATFQKAETLDANKGLIAISYFGNIEGA